MTPPGTSCRCERLPLKRIATINPEVLPEDTDADSEIAYVDIGGVTLEDGIRETATMRFRDAPSRARRRVKNGDTIVSTVRTYLRAIAPIANPPDNLIVSTGFAVIRSRGAVDAEFLSWALRGSEFVESVVANSVGVSYPAITPTTLGCVLIAVPPRSHQRAITAFLDRETAKIDALIAKQTEFLTRLDEHRRALITEAITHGLDPSVPVRQTGIKSLPTIPIHWDIKPLMRLTPDDRQIMYGIVLPGPDVPDGVPIVKGGDVKPGGLTLAQLKRTTSEIEKAYARSRLKKGDFVYAIRGSIGTVEEVPDEIEGANLTQDAARIAPSTKVNARWLLYALRSTAIFSQLEAGSLGAAVRGINIRDLKRARVPVPPLLEQNEIARYVDHHLARFERIRVKCNDLTARYRERRTALITAAVTGRIDVTQPALTEAAN